MPAASSRSDCGPAFDFGSRSSKRKFELWHRFDPGKCLVYRLEIRWVPNGPSEQPQRRPGVRERFRPSNPSRRCTPGRQKWPISWAFRGRLLGRESVAQGRLGGGRGTVVEPSLLLFQWVTNHTNGGGCLLENRDLCCGGPHPLHAMPSGAPRPRPRHKDRSTYAEPSFANTSPITPGEGAGHRPDHLLGLPGSGPRRRSAGGVSCRPSAG
jgi:hypothetical protein